MITINECLITEENWVDPSILAEPVEANGDFCLGVVRCKKDSLSEAGMPVISDFPLMTCRGAQGLEEQ